MLIATMVGLLFGVADGFDHPAVNAGGGSARTTGALFHSSAAVGRATTRKTLAKANHFICCRSTGPDRRNRTTDATNTATMATANRENPT